MLYGYQSLVWEHEAGKSRLLLHQTISMLGRHEVFPLPRVSIKLV
jgi:hypothetical protein